MPSCRNHLGTIGESLKFLTHKPFICQNKAGMLGPMEIQLYDEITASTAKRVLTALAENPAAPVAIRINSYGGDVFAAIAICNALKNHRGKKTGYNDGIAASAASLILSACDIVIMAENALLMIHGPQTAINGNAPQMRETAETLDKVAASMVAIYAAKTRRPAEEIARWLASGQDHWFDAEEALAAGLINEIARPLRIAARLGNLKIPDRYLLKMTTETHAPDPAIEAAAITAERLRVSDITALFDQHTKHYPEDHGKFTALKNELIQSGAAMEAARNQILHLMGACHPGPLASGQGAFGQRYNAMTPPVLPRGGLFAGISNPVGYGGYADHFRAAASDGMALNLGAKLSDAHPQARQFRGIGPTGLAQICLQEAGINATGLTGAALIKAALTQSDFPSLMGDAVATSLISYHEQATLEHRAICDIGDATDFKPQRAANVSFFPGLEKKLEGGEIRHGSLSEHAETYQIETFARMIAVSRELLANDNMGGIQATVLTSANASARLERDLAFGVLTANKALSDGKALFHADHGNFYDGTGNPGGPSAEMDVDGLNIARRKMRMQKDSSGGYLLTLPRFIVCPVALESDAEALVSSLTYKPASGEMTTPAWVKGLQVIADPRLDEASATNWYLLSETSVAPVIRLVFLNGARGPTVESEWDFSRDVMMHKVRMDIAACAVGYAGAVKLG